MRKSCEKFVFDDYSEEELYQILTMCLGKYNATMSDEAAETIRGFIHSLCSNRELGFANARTMKNLSRAILDKMLLRMSKTDKSDVQRIVLDCDVESFIWKKAGGKIGF